MKIYLIIRKTLLQIYVFCFNKIILIRNFTLYLFLLFSSHAFCQKKIKFSLPQGLLDYIDSLSWGGISNA